jgi:AhpD family alkylhydroperoxidase
MESQLDLRSRTRDLFQKYRELQPGIDRTYDVLPQEAYKDGALSAKNKRLMAMAASVVSGCRGCILFQAERAMELGATVDEVMEACGVAISLGGTMAAAETTRVVEFLEDLGRI